MRIRNYFRKHETLQLLLTDLPLHLVHSMKTASCPDKIPGSGELQGTVHTGRSSTSRLLPCQMQREDVKPLEPSPQLIKMRLHSTRNKTFATRSTINNLLANRAITFPNNFQGFGSWSSFSCLLNSIVTPFHWFPRIRSLSSHFPFCYCLLSATLALAVSPKF